MQLAGKHQDEHMSLGPPMAYIRHPQGLSRPLSLHLPSHTFKLTLGTYSYKTDRLKSGSKLFAYYILNINVLESGEW